MSRLPPTHPLCKIPGIVLTPHIAWRTDGAYIGMTKQVVQSIAAFFKGRNSTSSSEKITRKQHMRAVGEVR